LFVFSWKPLFLVQQAVFEIHYGSDQGDELVGNPGDIKQADRIVLREIDRELAVLNRVTAS